MITQLDHIAIAVPALHHALTRFCEDFGLTLGGQETVASAHTETAFLPIQHTQIELIQPLAHQGPVQKFIDQRGGGLHHLCFRSDDLVADMARLQQKGYVFIHSTPQPGAHGTRVAWIHPKSTDGVLIELAEYPADA